jgi:tetratricopeptide (TPR) repeat protein
LYLANTLRLYRAWGQVIAHEFESARAACEAAAPGLDSDGSLDPAFPPAFLPCEERIRLITLGAAQTGLGQYDLALAHLEAARRQMLESPVVLNWYWRIAAEWVLAQIWIAKGDSAHANHHVEELLALTANLPEATWRALALETAARVAMGKRDLALTQAYITKALATIENREGALATWRVHTVAAEFFELAGNSIPAQRHRELSHAAMLRLGGSLRPGHAFRKAMLASRPVGQAAHLDMQIDAHRVAGFGGPVHAEPG